MSWFTITIVAAVCGLAVIGYYLKQINQNLGRIANDIRTIRNDLTGVDDSGELQVYGIGKNIDILISVLGDIRQLYASTFTKSK